MVWIMNGAVIWMVRAALVTACSALGIACGNLYARRVSMLSDISYSIARFRTQVLQAQPLPAALVWSGHPLFIKTGERMKEDASLSAQEAFERTSAEMDMPLTEDDLTVLARFISLVSRVAREEQGELFDEAASAVEAQTSHAKSQQEKNVQVCRTVGCLGGLALMLLTL